MNLSHLVSELKRRRVFRAAAVYAAVAFAVMQAADVMLPPLGVPGWVLSLVATLTILGFPIAIVLAWAFELTPEGVKATAPASLSPGADAEPVPAALGRRTAVLAAALVLLGVGLGAGWFLKPEATTSPGTAASNDKSIAVLPFADMSQAKDQEWFSDGLTEEILNSLARLDEMQVTARNSSFQFKNAAVDIRDVGRQLGVANVLEGSVRRDDDRLRITAQLIRVADGFHLWSGTYDRHLDDVFAVQLDIAENIARVLDVFLDDVKRERMVASGTREPVAFLHYLRGRAMYNRAHQVGLGNSDALWQANALFDQALEIDPGYALARFYHHDAYVHTLMDDLAPTAELTRADGEPDIERINQLMRADLDRAVADAGEGPLGRSLALVRHYTRGEWQHLRPAIAAIDMATIGQASEIVGGGWLWYPLMIMRADDKVRELAELRLERDPLDVNAWSDMIELELRRGRHEEAQRLVDHTAELGMEHLYLDEARVRILLASGRAREVLTQFVSRLDSAGVGWWAAALAHTQLGDTARARTALESYTGTALDERKCWVLARMGDQRGANDCARTLDAAPQGAIRLTRVIVDQGSIPFDDDAAPRFTAMYRASGAPAWPRTAPAASR